LWRLWPWSACCWLEFGEVHVEHLTELLPSDWLPFIGCSACDQLACLLSSCWMLCLVWPAGCWLSICHVVRIRLASGIVVRLLVMQVFSCQLTLFLIWYYLFIILFCLSIAHLVCYFMLFPSSTTFYHRAVIYLTLRYNKKKALVT
jgi:hypothetical protein